MIGVMGKTKDKLNSQEQELVIYSDLDNLNKVEKFSLKICQLGGFNSEQCDNMAIALTELAINAIMHGNKGDKRKKVTFHVDLKDDRIEVSILDEGSGFDDQHSSPDPQDSVWRSGPLYAKGVVRIRGRIS